MRAGGTAYHEGAVDAPLTRGGRWLRPQEDKWTAHKAAVALHEWLRSVEHRNSTILSRDVCPTGHPFLQLQSRVILLTRGPSCSQRLFRQAFEEAQRFFASPEAAGLNFAGLEMRLPFTFEEFCHRGFCAAEEKNARSRAAIVESVIMGETEISEVIAEHREAIWGLIDAALSMAFSKRKKGKGVKIFPPLNPELNELEEFLDEVYREDLERKFQETDAALREDLSQPEDIREDLYPAIAELLLLVRENINNGRYNFLLCDPEKRTVARTHLLIPKDEANDDKDEDADFGRMAVAAEALITDLVGQKRAEAVAAAAGGLRKFPKRKTKLRPNPYSRGR